MGVIRAKREKNTTRKRFPIHPRDVEKAKRGMPEYVAELSTRTPLDELLTEAGTIASFCDLLRRATPNQRTKQDFIDLAKNITWLDQACRTVGVLLTEFPVLKDSVGSAHFEVGSLYCDHNWHRTIYDLGNKTLSSVRTPGGVCFNVLRPTKDGTADFDADLVKKNWPAIRVQLCKIPEFDLRELRKVLRIESDTIKERHAAELVRNGADKSVDTLKKSQKKYKRRVLNTHGKACIKEFKGYQKRCDTQSMRFVVREYVTEHEELSESSLYKMLSDNSDQWKT